MASKGLHTVPAPLKVVEASRSHAMNAKQWLGVGAGTVAAVGLHLSLQPWILCEPSPSKPAQTGPIVSADGKSAGEPKSGDAIPNPPPPKSSINGYELGFGTLCGICAGVFVKKGAKMVAFALGGVFVLLQYLSSINVISVNWTKIENTFEERFYEEPTSPDGKRKAPTVGKVWNWLVHFLVTDFPPRATFIAGFVLGLRIG